MWSDVPILSAGEIHIMLRTGRAGQRPTVSVGLARGELREDLRHFAESRSYPLLFEIGFPTPIKPSAPNRGGRRFLPQLSMVNKRKCESPARNTRSSKSSRRVDDVGVNDVEGADGGGSTPTTPDDLRAAVDGEQAAEGGVDPTQSTEETASTDNQTAPRDLTSADRDSTPMAHADPVVSVEVALPSESVPEVVESAEAVDDVHQ